jgi:hypothetical protein
MNSDMSLKKFIFKQFITSFFIIITGVLILFLIVPNNVFGDTGFLVHIFLTPIIAISFLLKSRKYKIKTLTKFFVILFLAILNFFFNILFGLLFIHSFLNTPDSSQNERKESAAELEFQQIFPRL